MINFFTTVALRKESVDRNTGPLIFSVQPRVALRKESVDRNFHVVLLNYKEVLSLSARRAWIEMANFCRNRFCPTVALRKESVDRNNVRDATATLPSVALRKESVDRNKWRFVG